MLLERMDLFTHCNSQKAKVSSRNSFGTLPHSRRAKEQVQIDFQKIRVLGTETHMMYFFCTVAAFVESTKQFYTAVLS